MSAQARQPVECLRCHYRWMPRQPGDPIRCARCTDPYWRRPYIRGERPAQHRRPWRKKKPGGRATPKGA